MTNKKKFCFKRLTAVALVIEPLALVVCSVCMRVSSHSFRLIVDPIALLLDTARACGPSIAILLTVDPDAFTFAIIWPSERTLAISIAVKPLSGVHCSAAAFVSPWICYLSFARLAAALLAS